MTGSCTHDNDPSGSIKFEELLDQLRLSASQEELCSIEFVSHQTWQNVNSL
jgi:hypothetical protein